MGKVLFVFCFLILGEELYVLANKFVMDSEETGKIVLIIRSAKCMFFFFYQRVVRGNCTSVRSFWKTIDWFIYLYMYDKEIKCISL